MTMMESAAHRSTVWGLPRYKVDLQSYFRPGKQAHNPMCPLYRKHVVLGTRQPQSPLVLSDHHGEGRNAERTQLQFFHVLHLLLLTQRHASTF